VGFALGRDAGARREAGAVGSLSMLATGGSVAAAVESLTVAPR
jgi:hypothetical protein